MIWLDPHPSEKRPDLRSGRPLVFIYFKYFYDLNLNCYKKIQLTTKGLDEQIKEYEIKLKEIETKLKADKKQETDICDQNSNKDAETDQSIKKNLALNNF